MKPLIILAALAMSTVTAHAQFSFFSGASRVVVSGRPLKLVFANATNPDCSSAGQTIIRVTRAPDHGRVIISATRDFPTFAASNIRSVCNRRRVAGVAAHYVSQRGFVGSDAAAIEVIYPNGLARSGSYSIDVR